MALYKAVLKSRYSDGNEARNVFYCTSTGAGTDLLFAIQGWIAQFATSLVSLLTPLITFYGVDIYQWIANEVWELISETGLNIPGDASYSEPLPHQIAPVLIGSTANGRSKAKKFIPGLVEDRCNNGLLTSFGLSTLATALEKWITDYTETNNVVVHPVVHRKGKTDLDFVGGKVDALVGTQRRRKQGVGI